MKNYFTQIPNEVAVSNIPDGLCRLLLYCYGNADTFRYSVAHLMDALNKDRRTTQRYVRELVSGGVLIPTAPHVTKFGTTPNYIFNADNVLKFLSTKESRQLRSENEAATNAATEPASEAATEPATPHHANNNNKQDQKPIITNQNKKSTSEKPEWLIEEIKGLMPKCPRKDRFPKEHITFMNNLSNQFGVDTMTLLRIYAET